MLPPERADVRLLSSFFSRELKKMKCCRARRDRSRLYMPCQSVNVPVLIFTFIYKERHHDSMVVYWISNPVYCL